MKALFNLAADFQIEVEPDHVERVVHLRMINGAEYDLSREPFTPLPKGSNQDSSMFSLKKAEARALGSALLSCASEV